MTRYRHWIAAAWFALLVQACTTGAQVRVDYDPKEDFRALRTFAWAPMTEAEQQEKARNSLTHERVRSAIEAYLTAHGYRKVAEDQADFLVTHTIAVESRTQVHDTRMSVGYGRYGAAGGVGVAYGIPVETTVYQYKVGTLIIDVIDARHKRLVWRGSGERSLEGDLAPEKRVEVINTTVSEILDRYPPTGQKTK
jgi:hypothetical protein